MQLDVADESVAANFPLYFSLQLIHFFGFSIRDNYSTENLILDLQEGAFTHIAPQHSYFLDGDYSSYISELLKVQNADQLSQIKLNKGSRREMLLALQTFYALHIHEFGMMKTLPVLHEILS